MARVNRTTARHFLIGVGGLVVMAALAALGAIVSSGGEIPAKSYSYATAAFHDVGTLRVRQDVRIDSLIVGQISDIRYEAGQAVVTLRMDGDHPVYGNASAKIWQESALARSFVELTPGDPSSGPLPGNRIPAARTADAIDLDQLFNVFDQPTRTALSGTLTQLGGGLLGHSADLRDALREAPGGLDNLGRVATDLTDPDTHLPALLSTANRVVGRLDSRSAQLRGLVTQTDQTLAAVNTDDTRPLDATLKDLPSTLTQARQALDSLNGPLGDARSAVSTIRPGGEALGDSAGDLRGVLREAVTPLDKVPDVADKATPAVEDLTSTVSDARPLAPKLLNTLDSTQRLLAGLSPYSPDIGRFFNQLAAPNGLLSGSISPTEHYFGIFPTIPGGPGLASLPDPTMHENPYPGPGQTAYRTNPDGSQKAGR
ncbi:MCE family protein [Actinomycetospora endophytica]|uniref:MCE family protein n=1 Tax=Actinomycetospora endophytica TaxID=2291215 RepID=A0ABS8P8J2_9PSEU|nr:MlaD family protein [Actinomycetospora endophytica]MCD2194568.1 MCE family protein [Actinomycetospora endophytica]